MEIIDLFNERFTSVESLFKTLDFVVLVRSGILVFFGIAFQHGFLQLLEFNSHFFSVIFIACIWHLNTGMPIIDWRWSQFLFDSVDVASDC